MKLKIDNETLAEEFFENTIVLGIVAPINDYNFCWHLNKTLGVSFRINTDLEIQLNKKKRNYFFSVYEFPIASVSLTHYLYNNQFDGEYLLPEFKHLDFLWLIKGDFDRNELSPLMQSIKDLPGVQMVIEVSNDQIKNKLHLIL